MGKTIAVSNLKGGVGKTMTAASLGAGLALQGKRVLCIDADAQHSLTVSFGVTEPDKLKTTLSTMMMDIINETDIDPAVGIVHHTDGVDLIPSNITLARMDIALAMLIDRETVLRQYIEMVEPQYDFVIVDCAPSLNLMTINALAAADSVIIPVVPKFLDTKGLELLLKRIAQLQRRINPALTIGGILLTMVDKRASFTREVITLIESTYSGKCRIFDEHIPRSVRASESTGQGVSIFTYEPKGKVASAYRSLVREVLDCA